MRISSNVDVDCVFNSTANNPGGILPNDADLSCISSIGTINRKKVTFSKLEVELIDYYFSNFFL